MLGLPAATRPSTSPAPNFAFADLRKLASYNGNSTGVGKPQPLAAAAAAPAASQSKLRPIPASSQGPRTQSYFSSPMMVIEGSRTGEEKQVSTVERRESTTVRPGAPLDNGSAKEKENQSGRDTLRIKKLEAEIRKLQEGIKKRTQEKEDASRRADDFSNLLDAANRKLIDRETHFSDEIRRRQAQADHFRQLCEQLEEKLRVLDHEKIASAHDSRSAVDKLAQDLRDQQAQYEKLRTEMGLQLDALRHENRQQKDSQVGLEKKISTMTAEGLLREQRWERETALLKSECTRSAQEADQLLADMKQKDAVVEEWRQKMDQCRLYIVKICQPQFSVVKDDSLTPVQPGSQDGGGFVLVPLQLMLEGYTLLPPDMKKKIADEYEATKHRPRK